jgi:hypothetical protein
MAYMEARQGADGCNRVERYDLENLLRIVLVYKRVVVRVLTCVKKEKVSELIYRIRNRHSECARVEICCHE